MVRRTAILLLSVTLLGSFLLAGVWAEGSKPPKEDYYELYKILVDTMDQVERNYVKDIDRRELMEAAIRGVLEKLDPYSTYISPEQISRFRSSVESEFGGIGIQISNERGQLTIISPLAGTPAYRAGLLAGDRIVEINGEGTEGIAMDEAVRRLKGKAGTEVKLAVIHPGTSEKVEVTITREIIHIDTVMGDHRKEDGAWDFMMDPNQHIGYLRITAFSRDTAGEIRKSLEQLQAAPLRGLVFDLRFNPGGLLSSAIEVSDLFIAEGRIVSTQGRNSPERTWDARKEGTFEGFPIAILVNRYSASASEIVSACLQDHQRAVVIGERTWGKGSVQNVIELEGGQSALKLTTASYRRPNGENIHRFGDSKDEDQWGVVPNEGFRIRLDDEEMLRLIDDRRNRDIVRSSHTQPEKPAEPTGEAPENGGDAHQPDQNAEPEAQAEAEEPAFIDRQLQKAVEYITGELAKAE